MAKRFGKSAKPFHVKNYISYYRKVGFMSQNGNVQMRTSYFLMSNV